MKEKKYRNHTNKQQIAKYIRRIHTAVRSTLQGGKVKQEETTTAAAAKEEVAKYNCNRMEWMRTKGKMLDGKTAETPAKHFLTRISLIVLTTRHSNLNNSCSLTIYRPGYYFAQHKLNTIRIKFPQPWQITIGSFSVV